MDYTELIHSAIEYLKQDKRVVQPWKNKAVARLEEAQAFIRMGLTTTNLRPPVDFLDRSQGASAAGCSCKPGMTDKRCAVHGVKA